MEIAFEITINNERKIVAGTKVVSVLSFIICYQKALSNKDEDIDSIELRVGGLLHHDKLDYEHLDWIKRHLKIGDEIKIRIVKSSNFTQPTRRREDPQLVEKAKRKYYENLKKEYEEI